MNLKEKLNNFWIGLIAGIIFPMIVYFFYWLFTKHQISFPVRYTHHLIKFSMLSNVIKVCGLGNLVIFYIGLNKKMDSFTKGVITSVLVYIVLIAYVTYYLEPKLL